MCCTWGSLPGSRSWHVTIRRARRPGKAGRESGTHIMATKPITCDRLLNGRRRVALGSTPVAQAAPGRASIKEGRMRPWRDVSGTFTAPGSRAPSQTGVFMPGTCTLRAGAADRALSGVPFCRSLRAVRGRRTGPPQAVRERASGRRGRRPDRFRDQTLGPGRAACPREGGGCLRGRARGSCTGRCSGSGRGRPTAVLDRSSGAHRTGSHITVAISDFGVKSLSLSG